MKIKKEDLQEQTRNKHKIYLMKKRMQKGNMEEIDAAICHKNINKN